MLVNSQASWRKPTLLFIIKSFYASWGSAGGVCAACAAWKHAGCVLELSAGPLGNPAIP